ncbi:MAG: hypothetical protein RL459_29, partial [Pseudomonadota bacterium]
MLARTAPPEPKPVTPVSPGWLLAVACAVLLVHLLVLNTSQLALSLVHNSKSADPSTLSFNTRRIDAAPTSAASAPARRSVRPVTPHTPSQATSTLPALNDAVTAVNAPSAPLQDPPLPATDPKPELPSDLPPQAPTTDAVAALAAPGIDKESSQATADAPY